MSGKDVLFVELRFTHEVQLPFTENLAAPRPPNCVALARTSPAKTAAQAAMQIPPNTTLNKAEPATGRAREYSADGDGQLEEVGFGGACLFATLQAEAEGAIRVYSE